MKNYIEISFRNLDTGHRDILIAELADSGYEGFEEDDNDLRAFISEQHFDDTTLEAIAAKYQLVFSTQVIPEQNWNEVWESGFEPVQVGGFAVIRAAFHPPREGAVHDIIITPKMSFGTGHHATTEMMVRRMEQISFSGKNVFDFGTGTGVLAILAEKCGAAQVLAIDNDPWSIANAKENAIENGCTRIHLQLADTPDTARQFDIILANINRNIILDNMPALVEALSHDGTLLVSGMLAEDETALLACTEGFQLRPVARLQTGPWICMQFAY